MDDNMKLHWKLHFEEFPNEKLLKAFDNPIKSYLNTKSGNILDIGSGQSLYLLDMLESQFNLFAVDIEKSQLDYLKERVKQAGFDESRITYSTEYFPSPNFDNYIFQAIIISDLLHFFKKSDAHAFVTQIKKYCIAGTLIIGKVHSTNHFVSQEEITPDSYFKSFYDKDDILAMFPESEFKLLSFIQEDSEFTLEITEFIKYWIHEVLKEDHTTHQIKLIEKDYLEDSRENFIKFVVMKK